MADASESCDSNDLPTLGKYRLERPIGEGGMGIVYSAVDTTLRRRVAIKMLSQALAADTEALTRFVREAQAAARLNHRNVVSIYEVARRGATYFIVMELVPGGNIAERLEVTGALPWREATRITADVCRGLAAAHAAGLVHRDVKPANFMLDAASEVKLADFGLSKVIDQRGLTLTTANQTCGTPAYMSPEQCRFDEVNELSDIYSLGASYFALLVGHPPFAGELPVQVMFAHCSSPCPDPCRLNANVPAACGAIVQRAMAKSPADRFGSAVEMLTALDRVMEGAATAPPPPLQIRSTPVPVIRGKARHAPARSRNLLAMYAAVVAGVVICVGLAVGLARVRGTRAWRASNDRAADSRVVSLVTPSANTPGEIPSEATSARSTSFRERIASTGIPIDLGDPVGMVAFSPRGELVAGTLGEDFRFKCVDLNTGRVTQDIAIDSFPNNNQPRGTRRSNAIFTAAFSTDGTQLAVGVDGPTHGTWLLRPGSRSSWEVESFLWPGPASSLAFSSDGLVLAVTFRNVPPGADRFRVWNTIVLTHANPLQTHAGTIRASSFLPDGNLLLGDDGGNLIRCNPQTRRIELFSTNMAVDRLATSRDGTRAAIAGEGTLQVWSLADTPRRLASCAVEVRDVAFTPDGLRLLTAGGPAGETTVAAWEVDHLRLLRQFRGHTQRVNQVSLSDDGSMVASASDDATIRLWKMTDATPTVGDE